MCDAAGADGWWLPEDENEGALGVRGALGVCCTFETCVCCIGFVAEPVATGRYPLLWTPYALWLGAWRPEPNGRAIEPDPKLVEWELPPVFHPPMFPCDGFEFVCDGWLEYVCDGFDWLDDELDVREGELDDDLELNKLPNQLPPLEPELELVLLPP